MAGDADDKNISDAPLEPWENKQLRIMLRNEGRVQWFWATIRLWAGYASGSAIGFYLCQDYIVKFLKKVFG